MFERCATKVGMPIVAMLTILTMTVANLTNYRIKNLNLISKVLISWHNVASSPKLIHKQLLEEYF